MALTLRKDDIILLFFLFAVKVRFFAD